MRCPPNSKYRSLGKFLKTLSQHLGNANYPGSSPKHKQRYRSDGAIRFSKHARAQTLRWDGTDHPNRTPRARLEKHLQANDVSKVVLHCHYWRLGVLLTQQICRNHSDCPAGKRHHHNRPNISELPLAVRKVKRGAVDSNKAKPKEKNKEIAALLPQWCRWCWSP